MLTSSAPLHLTLTNTRQLAAIMGQAAAVGGPGDGGARARTITVTAQQTRTASVVVGGRVEVSFVQASPSVSD